METAKSRLLQLLSVLGMGQGKFEKEIGAGNGTVAHTKDVLTPSLTRKIAAAYPSVNMAWLQTGKGDMFLSQPITATEGIDPEASARLQQQARLLSEITAQRAIIEHLQQQIAAAQQEIAAAQQTIISLTALCDCTEKPTSQQ